MGSIDGLEIGSRCSPRSAPRTAGPMTAASTTKAATPDAVTVRRITNRLRPCLRTSPRCSSGSVAIADIERCNPSRNLESIDIGGLLPEKLRQTLPGIEHMDLRGRMRASKDVRDFRQRAILEVEEGNGGSLLRRQLLDRVQQIDVLRYERRRRIARLLQDRTEALTACRACCDPDRDSPNPRLRPVVADHLVPMSEQLDEGLLGDVLGLLAIVDDQVRGANDTRELRSEERRVIVLGAHAPLLNERVGRCLVANHAPRPPTLPLPW